MRTALATLKRITIRRGFEGLIERQGTSMNRWYNMQSGLVLLLVCCFVSMPATAQYSGGSGTADDPYQIATAADLIALGDTPEDYGKHLILTADIDLDPNLPGRRVFDRAVIAPDVNDTAPYHQGRDFTGFFEGNRHVIRNLHIRGAGYLGLFGLVWGASISNLGMDAVDINGTGGYVGALAGRDNWHGNITDCYSTGSVTGKDLVGGLVGDSYGTITASYSGGTVRGSSDVGGLVGHLNGLFWENPPVLIEWCYSTASVSGDDAVGGLVGSVAAGSVRSSYSTGSVTATEGGGGLIGSIWSWGAGVTSCFWDIQTSGQKTSGGGTGLTTAEMQAAGPFLDAGWDFVGETANGTEDVWKIVEGVTYPLLSWQKYSGGTGEPNNPYQIATAADLIALGGTPEDYGKHFILTADIDLDPNLPGRRVFDRAVIAPDVNDTDYWHYQGPAFTGFFDGKRHVIRNLHIQGRDHLGLFGQAGPGAKISNLGLEAVDVNGTGYWVGGLVAWSRGSVIACCTTGSVNGGGTAGGLVGANDGTVIDSYSGCMADGSSAGGLVGVNGSSGLDPAPIGDDSASGLVGSGALAAQIRTSYSSGLVMGSEGVGGLVGENCGSIVDSYSRSPVSLECEYAGGLVGINRGSISSSYSRGVVSGGLFSGGLVSLGVSNITSSFWDVQTCGGGWLGGWEGPGGNGGLTTAEMQTASRFLAAGWDFVGETANGSEDLWKMREVVGYPCLAWEGTAAQIIPEPVIDWLDGQGTEEEPYRIDTAGQLILLGRTSELLDRCFVLGADIDLDPNLPGGRVFSQAVIPFFSGVFDGNDHTISHLTIRGGGYPGYGGLFGHTGSGARIFNLGLEAVDINGTHWHVGGVAGYNSGSITNCCSSGTVISSGLSVGGLVGRDDGSITACYSTGSVDGNGSVGGLVGDNSGRITDCYSTAGVIWRSRTWDFGYAGGGLVGWNSGSITTCYSAGGAGLTTSNSGSITSSFWHLWFSGQTYSGGTGLTTAEMQTASPFLAAGWDFVGETANGTEDIWWIDEGKDYPMFSWQGPAGMVFVDIPAGTFEMGDHDIAGHREDQKPVHTVTLDAFQMSKYETTNSQYAQYLNAAMADGLIQVVNGVVYASWDTDLVRAYCDTYTSSSYSQIEHSQGRFTVRSRDGKAMSDHPMARVSWHGAKAFCDYYGCRLPTEAEWEYAARGGHHDPYYRYPWGSDSIDCSKANCKTDSGFCNPLGLTSQPYTVPVGYYGPQGAYGLCDMSGNLWEWCQDWYDASYYSVSPASNPAGPAEGATRVLRGGAWDVHGDSCHVADRCVAGPDVRGQVTGFRPCR